MSSLIRTAGNYYAHAVVHNWGKEHKNFGVHNKRPNAVDAIRALFTRQYNQALLQSIIADMNEYGFGIIDDVHFNGTELQSVVHDVYPVTKVDDNLQNCLWHADNVHVNSGNVSQKHFDAQAITMLYGARIETEKYTGFSAVEAVSTACNSVCNDSTLTEPTVESLRDLADALGCNIDNNRREIYQLLRGVDAHLQKQERADSCVHHTWVQHRTGRLILFSNSIVHANDIVHSNVELDRNNIIYRRMLPSTPVHKPKR